MSIFIHFDDGSNVEFGVPEDFWSLDATYRDEFVRAQHPTGKWFNDGPGDSWSLKQYL